MALAVERIVLIVALVILFFGLALYGWDLCSLMNMNEKEGFTNLTSETSAPTRASDCRCLPGYIPSNTPAQTKYGGRIIHRNGPIFYIPNGSNKKHWVSSCTQCNVGINFCDPNVYVNVTDKEASVYEDGPMLTCAVLKESLGKKESPNYFCQSLSDPTQTKSCY